MFFDILYKIAYRVLTGPLVIGGNYVIEKLGNLISDKRNIGLIIASKTAWKKISHLCTFNFGEDYKEHREKMQMADIGTVDGCRWIVIFPKTLEIGELDAVLKDAIDLLPKDGNPKGHIIGFGGGTIMDIAKYFAVSVHKNTRKTNGSGGISGRKPRLIMFPSILSTTSWLNFGSALRKNGVLTFAANKRADKIYIDPDFIASAPAFLNIGGLTDIAVFVTAGIDWLISAGKLRKGRYTERKRDIPAEKFSRRGFGEFAAFTERLLTNTEILQPYDTNSVRYTVRRFSEALALCGASMTGRPLEGSEHFLFYAIEEKTGRRFIHGGIIALCTAIVGGIAERLGLYKDVERSEYGKDSGFADLYGIYTEFLQKMQNNIGFDRITPPPAIKLIEIIQNMPEYVKTRNHPYCIWDIIEHYEREETNDAIESTVKEIYGRYFPDLL